MPRRDLVTWNALIFCNSKCGMGHVGVELFRQMGIKGVIADDYTYAIVLNEFASRSQIFEAMQVYSLILRCGICLDRFVSNSLLNLYSKCGFIASAMLLFEEMPNPDVVSWTSIISGISHRGRVSKAFWLFHKMRVANVEPNSFTFGALFGACANSSAFQKGKQFHGLVLKIGLEANVVVASAIVDMYSKCGETDDAFKVFQTMPERDIASWNGIICGFSQNGEAMKALKLYDELLLSKSPVIAPNGVTFVGVLNACRHSGLVKEGYDYFNDMIHRYMIKPEAEHFTCMLDLLARAGLLQEAEALMKALLFKPDVVMLSSMLGACKLHWNLEMARHVVKRLYVDEPWNCSNYVLLSNLYADIGRSEAIEVREVMDDRGVEKILGLSWVEIGSCMHSFVAADKLHPCVEAICDVLQRLSLQMQESYQNEFSFPLN
ncbi:Pentatricopeptide repeat-containing protein [Camellia lanceoleosa]|uniref:Pentatricopeptide repeat-containing protein n=1 Tax=Camellia lanceoleosa TaxID=1840588 RepID=A0ACC0F5I7_9ERIC|nr:Pentatricopeptide repeat-containing protein [Camellia lanceoleosa]